LYNTFRSAYSWDVASGRELSVINRVYDENGRIWFMQPIGAAPSVLQSQAGVPEIRTFRRLQMPAAEAMVAGTEIGILEWWAGDQMVGSQTLVVR
jgi:hypothetical protein